MNWGRFSDAARLGQRLKPLAFALAVTVAASVLLQGNSELFLGPGSGWRSPSNWSVQGPHSLVQKSSVNTPSRAPEQSSAAQPWQLVQALGNLPLGFEPNQGQTDARVKFLSHGRGYALFLTADEAVLALYRSAKSSDSTATLHMKLQGANPATNVVAGGQLPSKSNYFIGSSPSKWRANIAHYAQVRYENIYPGVNLIYYGNQQQLEYDFTLAPGADPETIALSFEGLQRRSASPALRINSEGDLLVAVGSGEVRLHKPVAYQPAKGSRAGSAGRDFVEAHYVFKGNSTVGFEVASYDPSRALIIDPVLSYSTYLGGTADDAGYGIAVDGSGSIYVTGSTGSIDFPTEAPEQTASGGSVDTFVAKVQAGGSALVYSTYLGGNAFDSGTGLSVDGSGDAYIVGYTSSINFPTTSGAAQTSYGGGQSDAFLAKLSADGSALTYSTYLGGSDADYGRALAVDSSGDAFVTGDTQSADFPTASPLQAALAGNSDAFVTELDPTGSSLVYSTYLGGGGADVGEGIALDSSGNAYVAGYTFSTDFPTAHPIQSAIAGGVDAFIAKLNSAGSAFGYSTYFGGSGTDQALAIAVDSSGNAYITGNTTSANLPATAGALSTTYQGNGDAFFAKLNAAGSSVLYSSYLGGVDSDSGIGIAVNSSGNIYLTGSTRSSNFPTASAFQTTFGGGTCGTGSCFDAFVSQVDASGGSLVYSSYLGGSSADYGYAITLDSSGNAYVTGSTASPNFPATGGVLQPGYAGTGGKGDAFVVKVGPANAPGLSLLPQNLTFGDQATGTTSAAQQVTLTNVGTATLSISSVTSSGSPFSVSSNCGNSLAPSGGSCTLNVTFKPTDLGSATGTITISDSAAGSPHTINLTGNGVAPAPALTLSSTKLDFGEVIVGQKSPTQSVTVSNSGSATLQITGITVTGDYTETDTCTGKDIAPGSSCSIGVNFAPVSTGTDGTITGGVGIADNASDSPQNISLTGVALAEYTISSDVTSTTVARGTDSTTFTISASSPSGYAESINLSCSSSSSISCSFNPAAITAGETSTLTVTGLAKASEYNISLSVTGASTNTSTNPESASAAIAILLGDFSISASPPVSSVNAGSETTYTATLTPINQFSGALSLSCLGLPKETTCSFSPASPSLDGSSPLTATVTVKTTSRSTSLAPPGQWLIPPTHGGPGDMPLVAWLALLVTLTAMTALFRWRRKVWSGRVASLAGLVLVMALWTGCDNYYYNPITSANVPGTPAGTFTVAIVGSFTGTTTSCSATPAHCTTVNLTVR